MRERTAAWRHARALLSLGRSARSDSLHHLWFLNGWGARRGQRAKLVVLSEQVQVLLSASQHSR